MNALIRNFLLLYHAKNYPGAITRGCNSLTAVTLYHAKNYPGAITQEVKWYRDQELPGSYNRI